MCHFIFTCFLSSQEIDNNRDKFQKFCDNKGMVGELSEAFTELREMPEKTDNLMESLRAYSWATRIHVLRQQAEDSKKELNEEKSRLEVVNPKPSQPVKSDKLTIEPAPSTSTTPSTSTATFENPTSTAQTNVSKDPRKLAWFETNHIDLSIIREQCERFGHIIKCQRYRNISFILYNRQR